MRAAPAFPLQLHQAQQRLAAVQSSSEVAGNQAAAAQARLRASVRCLESLHALLKGALEQADGGRAPLDAKVRAGWRFLEARAWARAPSSSQRQ